MSFTEPLVTEHKMSRNFELLRKTYVEPVAMTERPRTAQRLQLAPPAQRHEGVNWLNVIRPVQVHWRIAAAFFGLVMLATIAVTFLMKPVYEPVAKLQIDPPGSQMFSPDRNNGASPDYMETQASNLQSDALALMVIRQLHLDQNRTLVPEAPEGVPSGNNADATLPQVTPAEDVALAAFRARLKVRRDTSSRIVMVSFAANDPELAAKVTNTLVATYIQKTYEMRHAAITESTEWLSKQLDDIKAKMVASNQALADFQKTSGIVEVDENKNTFADEMSDLNKQMVQISADRMQLESYLRKAEEGKADSLPQIRANPVVQALTQKLAETRAELAMTQVTYGKNHPMVSRLEHQQAELERQISGQRDAIVSELKTSYSAAVARERLMSGTKKGTSQEMAQLAQYNTLKKEAQANTALYNGLYAKVKEAGIAAASPSNDLNVVDQARVLTSPTRPNIPLNLGAGFMLALVGGVVLAFAYDRIDARIRTPEEIRNYIGVSSVSVLPAIESHSGLLAGLRYKFLPGGHSTPPEVFMLRESAKPEAEALRGLATSILLSNTGRPPQVLLIASSFPGEGKTTVAANLAVILAQRGPTCIVDADLRRPRIAAMFGLNGNGNGGLRDLLANDTPADDYLVPVEGVPNLTILPAGKPSETPGALVASEAMKNVVLGLRDKFDFVVIDSPPILPYADGRVLATHSDGVIFVGRSGVTTQDAMSRAMELLSTSQSAPVLEVVLNGATPATGSYHYYQYRYK
jgi:polysaccharide biosynthesis transport protein